MMKYKLSIIIPIYNVEAYIEECLDSLFSQISSDVEVIIINDGTPDRSMEIIEEKYAQWLEKDQVIVIKQENAGPGAARNRGLDVCRGEYIGFLDSDDVLLKDYFEVLLHAIVTYETDIVEFGFKRFYELSNIEKEKYSPLYGFLGTKHIKEVENELFSEGVWFPSIRIFKRELFATKRFPEGVFYEDLMCISQIYLEDLNIHFLDMPLLGYRFNPYSTTAVHTESHLNDMYGFYDSLTGLKETIPLNILKIRVGRSIAYFYNELEPDDMQMAEVLKDIRKIQKNWMLLKSLQVSDLFFFVVPSVYMLLDKIRLKRKQG